MPELRKDYVTDTWVVFSPIRSKRPMEARASRTVTDPAKCPFCEGHEHMTPPETLAYRTVGPRDGPGWSVRCVPNRYPALESGGELRRDDTPLFHAVNGVGVHEVIVETPGHEAYLGRLGEEQVSEVLRAYTERYRDLGRDGRFEYILIFKNHGEKAGATISHPHSQLIAMPIVPRRISEEVTAARGHAGSVDGPCIYCDILRRETEEGRRVVSDNGSFLALSPYAARFPFETWILPKAHRATFEDLDDGERAPLAGILRDVLGRMDRILGDPPFNYYIHTAPRALEDATYHWHVEITPRLTETAGFERGTGFYINPVMPEDAATILREGA